MSVKTGVVIVKVPLSRVLNGMELEYVSLLFHELLPHNM